MNTNLPKWPLRLLLLCAGAIFPLALAPFFWWPLGLVSLAGLVFGVTQAQCPRQAFINVWWYSLGQFITGVSWIYVSIHVFGGTNFFLTLLLVFLFAAFLALIPATVFMLRHLVFKQHLAWLTIPVFWFLSEWSRGNLYTGFPWLFAGDAHLHTWLAGFAPIVSNYGLSFLVMLTVTTLWQAWSKKQPVFLVVLLFWPLGAWLQTLDWTHKVGELKVSAVQGNIAQDKKWLPEMVSTNIFTYYQQTNQHWDSDLVLWPETAVTLIYHQFLPYLEDMAEEAQAADTTIITGIAYRHPKGSELEGEFHNSITAFGAGEGIYHKQKLVPFGEFVPLEKQLRGLIPFFDLAMSSFLAGQADQSLLTVRKHDQSYAIAPYICYEITYPLHVAHLAEQADLLVTISNDAWFGDSLGPKQHMALAQMRALETGRWLLRATNTGITALVDHQGSIVKQLPTKELGTLTAIAELRQGQTPFMRLGLLPLWGLTAAILMVAAVRRWYTSK